MNLPIFWGREIIIFGGLLGEGNSRTSGSQDLTAIFYEKNLFMTNISFSHVPRFFGFHFNEEIGMYSQKKNQFNIVLKSIMMENKFILLKWCSFFICPKQRISLIIEMCPSLRLRKKFESNDTNKIFPTLKCHKGDNQKAGLLYRIFFLFYSKKTNSSETIKDQGPIL